MIKNSIATVAILLLALVPDLVMSDTCPDHKTRCSPSQTCCSDNQGGYGCCPYKGATCCSDGSHCCPSGTTCDIEHSRCIAHSVSSTEPEWWTMIYNSFTREEWLAQNMLEENGENNGHNVTMVEKISCGGGEQTCPDRYTCCVLGTGGYGCCPFDGATCCPDKIHCCPHGKNCDVKGRRCL